MSDTGRPSLPLSVKTQVVAKLLNGETNAQIARDLGIGRSSVETIAKYSRARQSAKDSSVDVAMSKAGLTPESVAKKIAGLTQAKDVRLAQFEGKFTDRVDVEDNAVQHRAVELAAKILNMLPKEDQSVNAALFIKMPMVSLAAGHPPSCTCRECADVWESQTADALAVIPETVLP